MISVNVIDNSTQHVSVSNAELVKSNEGYYKFGNGLKTEKINGIELVSVDTADKSEKDNTLPITAAAVYNEIGNIDALLQTI